MAIYIRASGMNSQCKCLDFDRDLTNSDTFGPDSLFPASLEGRNRCTHHDHRYDKCLHFDMESVAHREGDLTKCTNVIINLGMHNNVILINPYQRHKGFLCTQNDKYIHLPHYRILLQ